MSDGDGMARLLLGPLGFSSEQVFVVLDPRPVEELPYRLHADHATKTVIEDLLFTRLPELVGPDDRVLIFFAGHGERRRLPSGAEEMGYLVPSDAQPMQWHTYIDLEAVTRAGNLCAAKHVFYLLDACYSGLATARAEVRERSYEEGMLTSRARQVLTAGTARQAVADKGPSGHSLFTWYVLQGLRGEADLFHNGVITGSQLMVHVRDRVASDFGSEQTPDFGTLPGHESGGDFVFVEPEFSSDEHFELGCDLLDVGRRLGDMGRFAAAARELEMAVQSTSKPRPEAWGLLGRAQFAAGNIDAATASFRNACDLADSRWLLHLGMARAKQRRYEEAIEALLAFSQQHPSDTNAGWAADFAAILKRTGGARRCGLLIGIGQGCDDDIRALREVMVRRLGFRSRDIARYAVKC